MLSDLACIIATLPRQTCVPAPGGAHHVVCSLDFAQAQSLEQSPLNKMRLARSGREDTGENIKDDLL
jgi:hypothetical protein